MKILVVLFTVFLLLFVPYVALAQEPTVEPTIQPTAEATAEPTAPATDEVTNEPESVVNGVVALVGAFAVLVTNFLVTAIKTIPYLSNEDKDKLAVAVTQVVAVVVGVSVGYLTSLVAQSLGLIADDSIRNMVIAILTPVLAELRYRLEKFAPVVVALPNEVHTMAH